MAGVEDMIKQAVRSVDNNTHGTPNEITRFYAERNGKMFLNELWCDMSITFWAFQSGNHEAVCFGTDFAFTKAHANRFKEAGQFHHGDPHSGDIAFFTRPAVQGIGHIGLVRRVEGGTIFTIEGNTSDAVRHRTHPVSSSAIVGYGRPNYTKEDDMTTDELLDALESPRGKKILQSVISASVGLVIRGDEGTPGGGTHPDNLKNIHTAVKEIKDRLPG
jgi:hypothetical protein